MNTYQTIMKNVKKNMYEIVLYYKHYINIKLYSINHIISYHIISFHIHIIYQIIFYIYIWNLLMSKSHKQQIRDHHLGKSWSTISAFLEPLFGIFSWCFCARSLSYNHILVGGWTNPSEKYARQIGSSPQVRMKTKHVWNDHLDIHLIVSE